MIHGIFKDAMDLVAYSFHGIFKDATVLVAYLFHGIFKDAMDFVAYSKMPLILWHIQRSQQRIGVIRSINI